MIIAAFLLAAAPSYASKLPEKPYSHIVDLAGIMDNGIEAKVSRLLMELEEKTGAQVVVLSVDSLEGVPLEEYSINIAEKWGLGQKDIDNGLLMLFAMNERKYRFEVGYGLEGILPDSLVGSIGREKIVPNFKRGDYSKGIASAALAVAGIIAKDKGVPLSGLKEMNPPVKKQKNKNSFWDLVYFILFVLFMLFVIYAGTFGGGSSGGSGGGSGGWGGGYYGGGGGSGGFGGGGSFGGGGGGFGGGGASGGW